MKKRALSIAALLLAVIVAGGAIAQAQITVLTVTNNRHMDYWMDVFSSVDMINQNPFLPARSCWNGMIRSGDTIQIPFSEVDTGFDGCGFFPGFTIRLVEYSAQLKVEWIKDVKHYQHVVLD